ncbi:MAG TPA: hypothetical protein VK203_06125 [Nostocaceae cyanobacterium]|nr:hypothetical protein [Nostocaceae cyanobacterium]
MDYKSFGLACLIAILPTQAIAPSVLAADSLPENSTGIPILPELPEPYCFPPLFTLAIPQLLIKPEDLNFKDRYLADITIQYAVNGQSDQALAILKNITDVDMQAYAAIKIAGNLQSKKPQETLKLISQIQKFVPNIKRDFVRDSVLGDIAVIYAKAGEFSSALQILPLIKGKYTTYKTETIIKIAIEYAIQGNLDKAKNIVKLLPNKYDVREALWKIGREYAILGKYDQAFDFASTMEENDVQAKIIENIFTSALRSGKINQVMPKILAIQSPCTKFSLVYNIVKSDENELRTKTEKLQRLKLALEIAQTLKEGANKANTLEKIAEEYIKIEEIDELIKLTQNTFQGESRNKIINLLVKYYLNNQQLETALNLANIIENTSLKVQMLTEVAKNYSNLGQKEKANELLNQALEIGQSLKEESYPGFSLPSLPLKKIIK